MTVLEPFYADDWLTLYGGDCREVLSSLPSDSVDCVVTSPPYWGLRDYGTAQWSGGDEGCDHRGPAARPSDKSTLGVYADGTTRYRDGWDSSKQTKKLEETTAPYRDTCGKCGATRVDSQLGLERTPEEYVANMVAVFREVRRVLKPSGTCWLNLGDSYATSPKGNPEALSSGLTNMGRNAAKANAHRSQRSTVVGGLKPKDLVGIPWRVAFALQADGWYLRSDIIWSKPNPMPESVTDRPTKSHEYLFLITKSARYYFDSEAVREADAGYASGNGFAGRQGGARQTAVDGGNGSAERFTPGAGRNIRSVWNIATRPYPGAHFAVFPPELPERCIKAGSSEKGGCPECGTPWERVVERVGVSGRRDPGGVIGMADAGMYRGRAGETTFTTTGWDQGCDHFNVPNPAVVLDPFGGSGTVGMVANRLSRRAILIDLNPEYLKQQMKRNAQTPLGLPG